MVFFLIMFFLSRVSFLSFSDGCHKMRLFLCKWVTHLQAEVSAFSKLLRTICSRRFCAGYLDIHLFWDEFLVLLKGVAKFLSDFTGEEPGLYLQFSRSLLSIGLWQRHFESKFRSAEVTWPSHRKTGATLGSTGRRTSGTAWPLAGHCSSSQGEVLRCVTACVCQPKLRNSTPPSCHLSIHFTEIIQVGKSTWLFNILFISADDQTLVCFLL